MVVQAPSHRDDGTSTASRAIGPNINFFFGPNVIVNGNTNVDITQTHVNVNQSSIGELQVGAPSSTLPHLLMSNNGTPFFCTQGESIEKILRLILEQMRFSRESSEKALTQIKDGNCSSCNGKPCTSATVKEEYSEEFMSKLNDMKSEDDIKALVKRGFYALVRDNEESKPILDFINGYKDEENAIESTFYNGREDLKTFLDLIWEQTRYRFANETCIKYEKQAVNIPRALACIVSKLIKKISVNDSVKRAITELKIDHEKMHKLGNDLVCAKYFLHASIAFFAAGKLASTMSNSAGAVRMVQTYLHQIRLIVENRVEKPHRCPRAKAVVTEILIPMMRILVEYLRNIKSADLKLQAEKDAWCSGCIAACYSLSGDFQNSIDEIDRALARMREKFGPKAETYRVYGMCINNKGSAFQSLYDFERANAAFREALEAYKVVQDWQNRDEKSETIKTAQDNLRKLNQRRRAK